MKAHSTTTQPRFSSIHTSYASRAQVSLTLLSLHTRHEIPALLILLPPHLNFEHDIHFFSSSISFFLSLLFSYLYLISSFVPCQPDTRALTHLRHPPHLKHKKCPQRKDPWGLCAPCRSIRLEPEKRLPRCQFQLRERPIVNYSVGW